MREPCEKLQGFVLHELSEAIHACVMYSCSGIDNHKRSVTPRKDPPYDWRLASTVCAPWSTVPPLASCWSF